MSDQGWSFGNFHIANLTGPERVAGYSYRGLGLDKRGEWVLSHLATGLKIARLGAGKPLALRVATEIAEAGDWDFDAPEGLLNRFPDAGERVHKILQAHGFAGVGPRSKLTEEMRSVCRDVAARLAPPPTTGDNPHV